MHLEQTPIRIVTSTSASDQSVYVTRHLMLIISPYCVDAYQLTNRQLIEQLQGYFDTSSLEIGVEPMVLGMHLGAYYGNLNKDFDIGINIIAAKGNIKLYLKKNALWVNCDIKPFGMNQFTQDLKIFDL